MSIQFKSDKKYIKTGRKNEKNNFNISGFLIANAPNEWQNQVPGDNQVPANRGNILTSSEQVIPASTPNRVSVSGSTIVKAELPGKASICIKVGDKIEAGDTLLIIECMKTMLMVKAPCAGTVAEIHVTNGQSIEYDELLVCLDNI